jgi:multidrug efflux pump
MGAALGGGYVNYFSISGRSYKVIPQVQQVDRLNPSDVLNFYIKTPNGVVPGQHRGQPQVQRAARIGQPLPAAQLGDHPGRARRHSQGETLQYLRGVVKELRPAATRSTTRASRASSCRSRATSPTFLFALIIVFLALAAQFESFRDPMVILVSVPMALFGAMIFIFWGFASMNIYTQVGLVTLMGLISKHGILIVEVANRLQRIGQEQARRDRGSGGHAAAAHPDDDGGHGVRRAAAGGRLRRRRGGTHAMGS